MTAPTNKSKIPLGRRVLFSVVIGGAMFLLLEVAMIILEPVLFKGFYQYDADLGFRVRPYTGESNRFGFNARDFDLEKPDNVYRILILGDSYNWIGGRDANYTTYIQHRFDDEFGADRVEVINAGYPMTHTGEQLGVLTKYGLQYSPDFVLLAFFIGNDFIDADPYRKRIVVNDSYVDIDRRYEMKLFGYPIIPHSRLWVFIRQKLKVFEEFGIQAAHAMSEETFVRVRSGQLQFFDLNKHRNNIYESNIRHVLGAITKMNQLLGARGIRFAVSMLPDQLQVDKDLLDEVVKYGNLDPNELDLDLANRILFTHLKKEDIESIDLLPVFKREREKKSLYIDLDIHWNNAGNQLAADTIFEFLARQTRSNLE